MARKFSIDVEVTDLPQQGIHVERHESPNSVCVDCLAINCDGMPAGRKPSCQITEADIRAVENSNRS